MQFRPFNGTSFSKPVGMVRKVLFAIACLISFICICSLISFRNTSVNAMNGELLTDQSASPFISNSQDTFFGVIFDYFGNVTYLFPLVIIYLGYKLFMKKVSIKDVDFFLIGTLILGFNLLVIGCCALFSSISSDAQIGAGGILGDFFTIYLHRLLPSQIATFIPILLTMIGLFLFTTKSPLWYCDKIGEYAGALYDRITNKPRAEDDNQEEEDHRTSGTMSVFDTVNTQKATNGVGSVKTQAKPHVTLSGPFGELSKTEPTFNTQNREPTVAPRFVPNDLPKFGQSSLNTGFGSSSPSVSSFGESRENSLRKDSRSRTSDHRLSFRANRSERPQQRIEPQFGPISAPPSVPNYLVGSARAESFPETASSAVSSSLHADDSPATYISGTAYSSNTATAPDYNRYTDDSSSQSEGSSTIINGYSHRNSGLSDDSSREQVQKTIISRVSVTPSKNEPVGSNYDDSYSASSKADLNEPSKNSTIIYKAGADHLPPTQTIGSPSRKSEVSTVITRTTTSTMNSNVNLKNSSKNSLAGEFSQKTVTDGKKLEDEEKAYENTTTTSSMFPSAAQLEENVIDFADLTRNDVPLLKKNGIKIDSLSSSFIPAAEKNDGRLNVNQSSPIKESDEIFEKYSRGSRGVTQSGEMKTDNSSVNKDSSSSYAESSPVNRMNDYQNDESAPEPSSFAGISSSTAEKTGNEKTLAEVNNSSVSSIASELIEADSSTTSSAENGVDNSVSENTYIQTSDKIPFDDMSSINGTVPYGMKVEPKRNPITSMPTVSYAVATETTPKKLYDNWRPALSLLARSNEEIFNNDEEIENKINVINKFMSDYSAKATVADFVSGPVITRFDMALEAGVKSNSIMSLSTDLQRSLMTNKINMIAAVPGTPYMGIEVPNDHRQMITLGDVVGSNEFLNTSALLPMCLGVNTVGNPVVADLTSAPHLLIAGTTGSGKSAGLNSMLVSLLLARSPAELRLIMVDPKTVEFTQYQGLPHLLTPIITDPESTSAALAWLIKEQERRYKLISMMNVSNIHQVNKLIHSENAKGNKVYDPIWTADMGGECPELRPVPYIVLVIDEFADLMAVASVGKKGGNSPEAMIGRLAAKARAAGIHLILATQTPRAEIVTGPIRANMPSRIAYTVQNSQESRIILDENGAENLLGNGDMIVKYQKLNNTQSFRAHGPYASNDDVHAVVQAWIDRAGDPEYVEGVTEFIDEEEAEETVNANDGGSAGSVDSKFDAIVDWIRNDLGNTTRLSISEIQTTHSVGYNRAKRIHRQLQNEGIIDAKGNIL
ncbi:DNA translocase FtsK 4TM domain-containing protein [Succinivibrio sp.]|uniref:DNA translocase FtsK 4TM domain-containing protein n=1 Tax=Succinivibrio sp. TaxID=2053619 RepID=UPI0025D61527|nr:DNA translocase FtsK 4TM domain-containing protein [Succinivibrio sp.]MBQ9221038.1 DNA translocase FtsK 4TM domain-containing protein [Succinivibrio sp.]